MMSSISPWRSSGTTIPIWRPTASSALNPYNRSAPGFHERIVPSRPLDRIASWESETIAASQFNWPPRDHLPNPRPRPATSRRFTNTPPRRPSPPKQTANHHTNRGDAARLPQKGHPGLAQAPPKHTEAGAARSPYPELIEQHPVLGVVD